jgi:tartrate dehydratase beta subunit/fumarate hydratase class I family protein
LHTLGNFFGVKPPQTISSPPPPPQFYDLTQKQIYYCGTCQTKQYEQATGPRTQENDSETETYSPKNQG